MCVDMCLEMRRAGQALRRQLAGRFGTQRLILAKHAPRHAHTYARRRGFCRLTLRPCSAACGGPNSQTIVGAANTHRPDSAAAAPMLQPMLQPMLHGNMLQRMLPSIESRVVTQQDAT